MFIFFLIFFNYFPGVSFSVTITSKGTLPLDKNSVALQFYMNVRNENPDRCRVGTRFRRCCCIDKGQDCDTMFIYGNYVQNIMPEGQETFVFVYPSVFHLDKKGICYFEVSCICGHKSKRKILEIAFDTTVAKLKRKSREFKRYTGKKTIRDCDSIDEDGLDDCSPVDCEVKYLDEKPFYDVNMNRCVRATTCIGDIKNDLPTAAYLPTVNLCRDLEHPVQIQDIYAINNGMSIVTDTPNVSAVYNAEIDSNCSTISQKLKLLEDILMGKMNPSPKGVNVDYTNTCEMTILSILGYIVCIGSFFVALICCVHTVKCFNRKWKSGMFNKKWTKMKETCGKKMAGSKPKSSRLGFSMSKSEKDVKDGLLRDVINHGIPMELRNSVIDVCDRIGNEVRWKRRYRVAQTGTPFEREGDGTISTASSADSLVANTSVISDEETLLN